MNTDNTPKKFLIEDLKAWIEASQNKDNFSKIEEINIISNSIEQEIDICLFPDKIEYRLEKLIDKYFPQNKEDFIKAINFIKEKHSNQYRDENTPYWTHLMMTAIYCIENWWTKEQAIASLLHDILEDTSVSFNELQSLFWEKIANLVKLVSFSVNWQKIEDKEYYENLKKSKEAILIKWVDRLSNIYSTIFSKDIDWKKWYIERTKKEIIPLIKKDYPNLAQKITEVVEYLWKNTLTQEQIKRIADLEKIKKIKEEINNIK
jgi:(p)ppGpp synthase/HD superfamily hydrolase